VLSFEPRVGKVKMDLTTGGFTVISHFFLTNYEQLVLYLYRINGSHVSHGEVEF